jgi:hypothetical protein
MQLPFTLDALDRHDLRRPDIPDRRSTSAAWFPIDQHRARAATSLPTSVFCPRQLQVIPQHAQQRPLPIGIHTPSLAIDVKLGNSWHGRRTAVRVRRPEILSTNSPLQGCERNPSNRGIAPIPGGGLFAALARIGQSPPALDPLPPRRWKATPAGGKNTPRAETVLRGRGRQSVRLSGSSCAWSDDCARVREPVRVADDLRACSSALCARPATCALVRETVRQS